MTPKEVGTHRLRTTVLEACFIYQIVAGLTQQPRLALNFRPLLCRSMPLLVFDSVS